MRILENIEYIASVVNRYEPLHEAGLIVEAAIDDISGLDSSLSELDKQVTNLQKAIDVYVEIFEGLADTNKFGGANVDAQESARECVTKLGKVRDQLDDIAQLDLGRMRAIGDFFGKDSSYKKGIRDLGVISAELGKIHAIAAGTAAAVARLSQRAKDIKMTDDGVKEYGLYDSGNGFFAKANIEFKDVAKQVKRTAKSMLPGVRSKVGGFFKGLIGGAKAKPLFGLSQSDISTAICNVKGAQFESVGQKIVSLGTDISKFSESMAKYKQKEKDLKKKAVADQKEREKLAAKAAKIASMDIRGVEKVAKFSDRIERAKDIVGDDMKEPVEAAIVALADEFEKIKTEGSNQNRYSMEFLLAEGEDDGDESDSAAGDEKFYEDLEDKIIDNVIDGVDDISTDDAKKIAKVMIENKDISHDRSFYRNLKLAGIKR